MPPSSATHNDRRGLAQESKHLEFQFAQRGHGASDGYALAHSIRCINMRWFSGKNTPRWLTSTITINRPVRSAEMRSTVISIFRVHLFVIAKNKTRTLDLESGGDKQDRHRMESLEHLDERHR